MFQHRLGARPIPFIAAFVVACCLMPWPASAQPCQPSWSSPFVGGDFDGAVRAMTLYDNGGGAVAYAAGGFTRAGGVHAQGVARWTGSAWAPVGGDFDGDVNALIVHDDGTGPTLFAGGLFRSVGGVPADFVAKWNGVSWVALGTGTLIKGGGVYALASHLTGSSVKHLFAGGDQLYYTNPVFAVGVLQWSGSTWLTPQSGTPDIKVYALAAFTDPPPGNATYLYAAGKSNRTFSSYSKNVARWSGSWSDGSGSNFVYGTNGQVNTMAVHHDGTGWALVMGGEFTVANLLPANRLAKWNGQTWAPMGTGADGPVRSLATFDPDGLGGLPPALYAGGDFQRIGSVLSPHLARWEGADWSGLSSQPNDSVYSLVGFRVGSTRALLCGGAFSMAGETTAMHAAGYSLAGWLPMANTNPGTGPSQRVRTSAVFDPDGPGPTSPRLYIGGDFMTVGTLPAKSVASWDGSSWSALGGGLNGSAHTMEVYDDGSGPALYVGGQFTQAGGAAAPGVARWNGSVWEPVGGGLAGLVRDLQPYIIPGGATGLYACGEFPSPTGGAPTNVALWNGLLWLTVGPTSGQTINGARAMKVFDSGAGALLCVSGEFLLPGISQFRSVATWNGQAWGALPQTGLTTIPAPIMSLEVHDDGAGGGPALYAAGSGLIPVSGGAYEYVARFNGSAWAAVAAGPTWTVHKLRSYDAGDGPALYAAGEFQSVGTLPASRLARWKSGAWERLGTGVGPAQGSSVLTLTPFDDDGPGPGSAALFAGGSFTSAGGQDAPRLARWGCPAPGPCYANCDGSTVQPILNVADFVCFHSKFAAADPYANCDGSTIPPVLNVADFICFQTKYGAGCP
jgi:trimeric autotransporter adhesin